jgi:hypothetical protein
MNFKALFPTDVYIRLSDDLDALVCTVQLGRLRLKSNEFAMAEIPARNSDSASRDGVFQLMKSRYRWPSANSGLASNSDPDGLAS